MKVSFTPQIKMAIYGAEKQSAADKKVSEYQNNTGYNPIAYRDYNISFGERLFRTPENFYEQDFNKKNMPQTLYDFIYTGDETFFKRTIPPAQAMGIVFKDIEDAKNLDEVKAMFPDEPLFEELSSTPKVKSREGLLGAINLFKDDPEYIANNRTLFKNGENDLGMYILKKIYLEGKPLKEINKDFKKDVSVYYEGFEITPKDYMAFGIRFPKHSFWHSYIATREDFEYVRVPRHLTERAGSPSGTSSGTRSTSSPKPRNPRYRHVTDWDIGKITDTVTGSGGSKAKIRSQLDRDKSEASSFVAKYMSEIMYVTMERMHMSPEMKAFFNNYDNINEDQRAKLKKYWDSPKLREDMSYVMKSTIRMFMEAYDEDGENEYFKDLIDYAHSIKPKREAAEAAHNEKQLDYEQIFADPENVAKLDEIMAKLEPTQSQEAEQTQEQAPAKPLTEEDVKRIAQENGAKIYKLMLPNEASLILTYKREDLCNDLVEGSFGPFPQELKSRLYNYILNSNDATDEYLLAIQVNNSGLSRFVPRDMMGIIQDKDLTDYFEQELRTKIMPEDEINKIARAIGIGFEEKNRVLLDTSREVMLELINSMPFDHDFQTQVLMQQAEKLTDMTREESFREGFKILDEAEYARKVLDNPLISTYTISELADVIRKAGFRKLSPSQELFVKEKMDFYRQPLSNKELKQLSNIIPEQLLNFNIRSSDLLKEKTIAFSWDAVVKNIKAHPELRRAFVEELKNEFIQPEKSWLRSFLNPNTNSNVQDLNTQMLIAYLFKNKTDFLKKVMAYDLNGVSDYIKYHEEGLYGLLVKLHRELQLTREFDKYKK